MRTSGPAIYDLKTLLKNFNRQRFIYIFALICLMMITWVELGMAQVHASSFDHTAPTVKSSCAHAHSSPDGNPFPLCPGPFPNGGNCVWWAWEQWHLLGYDLPPNWGNAADWIVDAERVGLPIATTPRPGSIAVFPRADGVWAYGPVGHVAFVTWVSPDVTSFNVTYQNYGDATPMFTGRGYNVSVINEPRFQNGEMRFIYFPKLIDPTRFTQLPGVNGNGFAQIADCHQDQLTRDSMQTLRVQGSPICYFTIGSKEVWMCSLSLASFDKIHRTIYRKIPTINQGTIHWSHNMLVWVMQ